MCGHLIAFNKIKSILMCVFILYSAIMFGMYNRFFPYGLEYQERGIVLINWYIGIGALLCFQSGNFIKGVSGSNIQYLVRSRDRRKFFFNLLMKQSFCIIVFTIIFIIIFIIVNQMINGNESIRIGVEMFLPVILMILTILTLANIQIVLEAIIGILSSFLIVNAYVLISICLPRFEISSLLNTIFIPNWMMYLRLGSTQLSSVFVMIAVINTLVLLQYYRITKRKDIIYDYS